MWKIALGFIAFAALALTVLMQSGPVDLGGEHAAQEAMHTAGTPAHAETDAAKKP